jgi:DNA-binding protein H-NS
MAGSMDKQLSKMTLEELISLRSQVDKMIKEYQVGQKKDLRRRFKAMAAEMGLTIDEVLGLTPASAPVAQIRKRNYVIKYQNPANPSQTWTGLGMKPRWVRAHLEQGGSIEELLIPVA